MKDKEFERAKKLFDLFYHLRAYLKHNDVADGLLNHLRKNKKMYLALFDCFDKFFEECKFHKQTIECLDKVVKKELGK